MGSGAARRLTADSLGVIDKESADIVELKTAAFTVHQWRSEESLAPTERVMVHAVDVIPLAKHLNLYGSA